jgi:predicted nucleic acid-binding protein
MKVLLDSNVLLRWNIRAAPQSQLVIRAIDRLIARGVDLCYTSQNLGEFWNVLTRPLDRNGFGLTPAEAEQRAERIEDRVELLPDNPTVHLVWRRLLIDCRVSGVQVHDARLVASMLVHGVPRILTFNTKDFARFGDIEAVHPADLSK